MAHLSQERAAAALNVGNTRFKSACRELGVRSWPYRRIKSVRNLKATLLDHVEGSPGSPDVRSSAVSLRVGAGHIRRSARLDGTRAPAATRAQGARGPPRSAADLPIARAGSSCRADRFVALCEWVARGEAAQGGNASETGQASGRRRSRAVGTLLPFAEQRHSTNMVQARSHGSCINSSSRTSSAVSEARGGPHPRRLRGRPHGRERVRIGRPRRWGAFRSTAGKARGEPPGPRRGKPKGSRPVHGGGSQRGADRSTAGEA